MNDEKSLLGGASMVFEGGDTAKPWSNGIGGRCRDLAEHKEGRGGWGVGTQIWLNVGGEHTYIRDMVSMKSNSLTPTSSVKISERSLISSYFS